ncbi:hypothetical protein M7I_4352 [Glarea lozoyensis 74030]|uniref:Uncharacterized protein n=1 Tax=Glarea lozoyensis (strain ATCC 74030 / MF5533) TaxID=1104152 RepID=H0ENY7_GLAL7|nr:hypothetical protein M7I_4352 [Glarea lozoyensis 74030]
MLFPSGLRRIVATEPTGRFRHSVSSRRRSEGEGGKVASIKQWWASGRRIGRAGSRTENKSRDNTLLGLFESMNDHWANYKRWGGSVHSAYNIFSKSVVMLKMLICHSSTRPTSSSSIALLHVQYFLNFLA